MDTLRDVFTPDHDDQPPTQATPVVPAVDPVEVDRNYQQLTERRQAAQRARAARQNAVTARAVAQSFSEYGRAFRKVAATKGSPVDHAVCEFLAATCEEQSDIYTRVQADCVAVADREGSL
jgi:hypothetical protein